MKTLPQPAFHPAQIAGLVERVREPAHVVATENPSEGYGLAVGGHAPRHQVIGILPPLYPEWLGDRTFGETHGTRFPYVAGEMAGGIATVGMVEAMARGGMLGFFGAGGLGLPRVHEAVAELRKSLLGVPNWGVNLIHSPNEPATEDEVADLLIRNGVPCVCASAFTDLTPAVVRCSAAGLSQDAQGRIIRRTRMFAKISRPETAERFLSPAPPELLRGLVDRGLLTAKEAELAALVPVAEDITVEADSGGHTDNRPLVSLLPVILSLRDKLVARFGYDRPVRVGAAGGLGTPTAVAAAFAGGAAYVVTGSVNQVAVESGLSQAAKDLLAAADLADVTMAPAADMFEQGVKVQVLRRGTMFAARATQLYEAYRDNDSLEDLPERLRARIERDILRMPVAQAWAETERFWQERDPAELTRARVDPKHRMALVFRSYLGRSSRWAVDGDPVRRTDYQIWCGPAIGAFNRWTAGTFLAEQANRTVVQIALNLLEGAAVITRAHQLRVYGLPVPPEAFAFAPRRLV
ncbi:PfaD family polyunsaturated fatty acid/polyketide biosynthesis protein [Allokutzneria sp. A3M-2-11 16]|uniref:PfaD family polyunsaturated fatty acid/polyketide biosynthesis protein n=1 Tax=Allokutzneria sp. A3M-2-11 16 TaxID=2962043 RepID=UPI0020B89119|nr:PfaD family polyunsaturated fatty acid/polyketide biosynthesis protein [Allokutzneria sp. A3M-2-11 16]MCP3802577.1 PfaD family polyunsaturated fatty acid/polyketide biosynthesis protein [Allokutzneria sp. A3M-2-11 16]